MRMGPGVLTGKHHIYTHIISRRRNEYTHDKHSDIISLGITGNHHSYTLRELSIDYKSSYEFQSWFISIKNGLITYLLGSLGLQVPNPRGPLIKPLSPRRSTRALPQKLAAYASMFAVRRAWMFAGASYKPSGHRDLFHVPFITTRLGFCLSTEFEVIPSPAKGLSY